MEGIHNFRDFGGYQAQNGLHVKRGMLYRSGSLAGATESDIVRLEELGIRTVCDLRTPREQARHPDPMLPGGRVAYHHVPMKARQHDESGRLEQLLSLLFGRARTLRYEHVLNGIYQEYVKEFKAELGTVVDLTAQDGSLPILIHCTAGKDRTGLACGIILCALSVPYEAIVGDYLLSNELLHDFRDEMLNRLKWAWLLGVSPERFRPLFGVRREYMDTAFAAMRHTHRTVESYVRHGLGLSDEDRSRLCQRLLERRG